MTRGTLVDAGTLVAILHRDDQDHQVCVGALRVLRGPLFTTCIPITEAMYLLEFSVTAQGALIEMIERRVLQALGLRYALTDAATPIGRQVEQAAANAEESSQPFVLLTRDSHLTLQATGSRLPTLPPNGETSSLKHCPPSLTTWMILSREARAVHIT